MQNAFHQTLRVPGHNSPMSNVFYEMKGELLAVSPYETRFKNLHTYNGRGHINI